MGKLWSDEEVLFLKENYMTMTDEEIADVLGNKTKKQVKSKRGHLRLTNNFSNKPPTQEYVNKCFEEKGCILLTPYIQSHINLKYICKCGTPRETTFGKFMNQKHGCRVCTGLEKYTQEQAEKYFEDNGCKLISEYTGANDDLSYICSCGNESKITLWNFRKGNRCKLCGLKKLSDQLKYDIEHVRQIFIEGNCVPLFTEYNNSKEPLDYICECGNQAKIALSDFQNGKRCNKCRVERIHKTMYENGTQQCSTQQRYIHSLIGGELNYPIKESSLDIAFINDKLYVEYDGGGHDLSVKLESTTQDEFDKKERNRRYALYRSGWKEIRIISKKDYLPNDNIILEMVNYAKEYLNTGHSWIKFDIDNQLVKCSQFNIKYNYNTLRRINKELINL